MEEYQTLLNIAIEGDDITTIQGTVSDCINACNNAQNCVGFVRDKTAGDNSVAGCILKNGFNIGYDATYNLWLAPLTYEKTASTNITGADIVAMNDTVQNCSALCASIPGCVGFTRPSNVQDNVPASCSLKNSFNTMVSDSNNNLFALPKSLYLPQQPTCSQCANLNCPVDCTSCANACPPTCEICATLNCPVKCDTSCPIDCNKCALSCGGTPTHPCPKSTSTDKKWIIFLVLFLLMVIVSVWLYFFRK